jgi:hypothetical protein
MENFATTADTIRFLRATEAFPSNVTHIELVRAPDSYAAQWKLTLWATGETLKGESFSWRRTLTTAHFDCLDVLTSQTGWRRRWSNSVVARAVTSLDVPGFSGLTRILGGGHEEPELRFRVYDRHIRVLRLDDSALYQYDLQTNAWTQR